MHRKWLVFAAVSMAFFFATAATFTSLGVVVFTMAGELHWSQSDAGISFSLMALACGLSSPVPAVVMQKIGSRLTLMCGSLILAAGFYLASMTHGLPSFFLATTLMGAGFTLVAPIPGISLIPAWFPQSSSRMIGFYFMLGALGGIAGPPLVEKIVQWSGSWRMNWLVMGHCSLVIGAMCLVWVRDGEQIGDEGASGNLSSPSLLSLDRGEFPCTPRAALFSKRFLYVAVAMLVIQTGMSVIHSMLVAHVARLGGSREYGALALSLIAMAETTGKGVAGPLTERLHPRTLLLLGMILQALAFFELWLGRQPFMAMLFAPIYGTGWGLSWIGANVLLMRYYGRAVAPKVIAFAVTITTLAIIGPIAAGAVADHTGTFTPVFLALGIILGITALLLAMQRTSAPLPLVTAEDQPRPLSTHARSNLLSIAD